VTPSIPKLQHTWGGVHAVVPQAIDGDEVRGQVEPELQAIIACTVAANTAPPNFITRMILILKSSDANSVQLPP